MPQHENDISNWIEQLAGALNALAPTAVSRSSPALGISFVDFLPNTDLTAALEILRGHPILKAVLSGPGTENDAFMAVVPNGAFRIELRVLVGCLVLLATNTGDKNAAETMHRFLDDGNNQKLEGHQITVFDGLKLDRRVDLGDGAFIAPLDLLEAEYALLDEKGRIWMENLLKEVSWEGLPDSMKHEILHYRDIRTRRSERGEGPTALVMKLTWGPAVVPANYGGEVDNKPRYDFPVDEWTILNLLSIAMRMPMIRRSTFIAVDRWMEGISYNFNLGGSRMSRYPDHDRRTDQAEMSQDHEEVLIQLIHGWQGYKGKRNTLDIAIRKFAGSYYRTGDVQRNVEDAILDIATVLEVLYQPDVPEITYKLASRAGWLIGTGPEDRFQIFKKVGRFYRVRSRLTHSGKGPRNVSLEQARKDGSEVVLKTLLELLRRGSPPGDWDRLVMGCTG